MNLLYCVFVLKSKTTKTSEISVHLIEIVLKEHTVGLTGQQRMLTPSSIDLILAVIVVEVRVSSAPILYFALDF